MLTGGEHLPYRLPAGGVRPDYFRRPNHATYRDQPIEQYEPTLTVENILVNDADGNAPGSPGYTTTYQIGGTAGAGTCPPYETFNQTAISEGSCDAVPPASPSIPGGWIGAGQYQFTLVSGQPNTAPTQTEVDYDDADATVATAVCNKYGFKNVAAKRNWHGTFGFTDPDISGSDFAGCATNYCTYDDPTLDYSFTGYQSSPNQTKFTTYTCDYSATTTAAEVGFYVDDSGNITGLYDLGPEQQSTTISSGGAVDPNSGLISSTGNSESYLDIYTDQFYDPGYSGPSSWTRMSISNGVSTCNELVFSGMTGSVVSSPCGPPGPVILLMFEGYCDTPQYYDTDRGAFPYCTTLPPALECLIENLEHRFSVTRPADTGGGFSFSGGDSFVVDGSDYTVTSSFSVVVTRTNSTFTWDVTYDYYCDTSDVASGPDFHNFGSYAGTIELSGSNAASDVYADAVNLLSYWDMTDDHRYPWRSDGLPQVAPLMARNEKDRSSPVNGFAWVNDMANPATDANGNSPFTSGTTPPPFGWTYAPHNNDGSGLSYTDPDWAGPASWEATYNQIPWFDSTAYLWYYSPGYGPGSAAALGKIQMVDGSILGEPLPAGYQNYFMWDFEDWEACVFDGGVSWHQRGYGMWLEDYNTQIGAQLPLCATRWTNNFQVINKGPGAGIYYGNIITEDGYAGGPADGGSLWVYKYAATAPRWQSVNFARPAGADRFVWDEANVYCVASQSGSGPGNVVTLFNLDDSTNPSSLPFTTADIVGGAVVGGFYAVSSVGTDTVTLGAFKYAVPTGWSSPSGDDATAFGRLLWPHAPGILGRTVITPTDNGDGTINLAGTGAFQYSVTGDKVNLYNSVMTSKGSNLTLTRIDDNTAKVTATFDAGIIYVTPYLLNDGVTDGGKYYFCDDYPKGDALALTWTADFRTNGEAARLSGVFECDGSTPAAPATNNGYSGFTQTAVHLAPLDCAPSVVCWSPNGESFRNGVTYDLPSVALDELYTTVWQGWPQLVMTDPFWQTPHKACGFTGSYQADDGTCKADYNDGEQHNFFALGPQVEPLMALPSNYGASQAESAPALAAGASPLGWLSPVSNPPGADVLAMPGPVGFGNGTGYPLPTQTAEILKINLAGDVAPGSSCRFSGVYSAWVIRC